MSSRSLPLEGRTLSNAITNAIAGGYQLQQVTGEIVERLGGAIITAELTDHHNTTCIIETRQILPLLQTHAGDSRALHEAVAHPYPIVWQAPE